MQKIDFGFLSSNRFWALVLLSVFYGLLQAGIVSEDVFNTLSVILLGHIGIKTIDRASEKLGNK